MSVPDNCKQSGKPSPPPLIHDSSQLFGAGREVIIRHAGEFYRLRVTRQNKLILTK